MYKILPGAQYFLPLQAADSLIPFRPANEGIFGNYPGLTNDGNRCNWLWSIVCRVCSDKV